MNPTKKCIVFILFLLILTPLTGAAENEQITGGNSDISVEYEYTGLTDFIKQIFSNPFSTIGAQTNIWVADNFNIGAFDTVRISISGEKYTYNQGDNLKVLSFFNHPGGKNIRVKIFKENQLTGSQTQVYDTGEYNTGNWEWAYWITERNNVQAGTYIVKSYYNNNAVKTREYVVKPTPPSHIFNVDDTYQTGSNINLKLVASKGSIDINKYSINFGDGTIIDETVNAASINTPIVHNYDHSGDFIISVTLTDSELNEYESTYPVKIADAGLYSDTILDYEEYHNIASNGSVNVKATLTPNLERHYRVLIDGELIYDSNSLIISPREFEKSVELFIGRHDITAESSYDGISYVEVYNGVLYARYIPTIAYNTNYVNSISGTLEHNEALIDTEILLYKNGEYFNKADTVNGYYSFTGLDDGVYNVVFMGNDDYADGKSPEINIGDVSGIDVKTIDLNKPTLIGYIGSIIDWLRGLI